MSGRASAEQSRRKRKRAECIETVHPPDEPPIRRDYAADLRHFVLDQYRTRGMDAKLVATLSHKITNAGGHGVADLALDPEKKGCNHARHIMTRLRLREDRLYWGDVRMFDQKSGTNRLFRIPHERRTHRVCWSSSRLLEKHAFTLHTMDIKDMVFLCINFNRLPKRQ